MLCGFEANNLIRNTIAVKFIQQTEPVCSVFAPSFDAQKCPSHQEYRDRTRPQGHDKWPRLQVPLTFSTPRSRVGVMSSPRSASAAACTSPSGLVASSVVIVPRQKQHS